VEHYRSRIKLGNKGADFGRKSYFPETSYRTMSDVTRTRSGNPQSDNVWLYLTMFGSTGQCLTETFSPTSIYGFGHILLTGCPIDSIVFLLHSQLQGDNLYAICWCVHHLLSMFWLWGLNLRHRPVLEKEFYSAPVHPPSVASLDFN
jgi:hypothetical protein